MADIYFVRHGQASFGKVNYDALSNLGHEQARIAGEYLSKVCHPDVAFHGSLVRQQQTFTEIAKSFTSLQATEHVGLNEFNHENVLAVHYPEFLDREAFAAHIAQQDDPKKYFHRLYQRSVKQWLANEGDYQESFDQFKQRVVQALNDIQKKYTGWRMCAGG